MLSKVGETLRSLVEGEPKQSVRRGTKRQLESPVDDILTTPAKRNREEPEGNNGWGIPIGKMAEWVVKKKRTFADSYYFKKIASSPGRIAQRISSMSGLGSRNSLQPNQEATSRGEAMMRNPPGMADMGRGKPMEHYVHSTPKRDSLSGMGFDFTDMSQAMHAPPNITMGADGQFQLPQPDGHFKIPARPYAPLPMMDRPLPRPPLRPGCTASAAPRFSSTPGPGYSPASFQQPVYDKNFPFYNTSITIQPMPSRNKIAAKESFKLEEKSRYAQLLQQFTSTPLDLCSLDRSSFMSHSRRSNDSFKKESLLGTPIPSSASDRSVGDEEVKVIKVQPKPCYLSDRSLSQLKAKRMSRSRGTTPSKASDDVIVLDDDSRSGFSTPKTLSRNQSEESLVVTHVEPPKLGYKSPTQELFEKSITQSKCVNADWFNDLKESFSSEKRRREREIKENEIKVEFFKEKREEWEQHLEDRIQQKLRLAARQPPVLEDVEPEEEEDEFPELTDEMELQINNALRPYPPGEVLVRGFNLNISRKDMETLARLNWLNDEIINFYMELLRERSKQEEYPSVHIFNTFFYPRLLDAGHKGVARWTKRVDVFAHDFIVVPIHLGMHWCLAIVDFQQKAVRYFDSMGGNNNVCVQKLRDYLMSESLDKKKKPLDMSGWKLEIVKGIPQQMNGSDCGVFTCKYAEYLVRRKDITFTQEHMPYFRRRMVYEILNKKLL